MKEKDSPMKNLIPKIVVYLLCCAPLANAFDSTNTKAEDALNKFISLLSGKVGYYFMFIGFTLVAAAIILQGLGKSWPALTNTLIGGGILFGIPGIMSFFFGINVSEFLLP